MSFFFVDRCISPDVVRITRLFDPEHTITFLEEKFAHNTDDSEWMQAVALWTPQPIVISGDGRILRNAAQKQVLRNIQLTWVALAPGWPRLEFKLFVIKFLGVWGAIVEETGRVKKPTLFNVPIQGKRLQNQGPTSQL